MTDQFIKQVKAPRVSAYPFNCNMDNASYSTLRNVEKEMKWRRNSTFLLLRSYNDTAS